MQHCPPDPRQPHHPRRFPERSCLHFQLLGDGKVFLDCGPRLRHGPRLSADTQSEPPRWRQPAAPLALRPGPAGWAHYLAAPGTTCRAVNVFPHLAPRHRQMRPEGPGCPLSHTRGPSLERCAVLYHSPRWPHRLLCAFGHQRLGALLTRCGLPLPTYVLADEKHSRCLAAKVYLPTIVMVGGWGIWGTPRRPVQWLLPSPMACFNAPRLNKNRRIGSQGPSPRALTAPP